MSTLELQSPSSTYSTLLKVVSQHNSKNHLHKSLWEMGKEQRQIEQNQLDGRAVTVMTENINTPSAITRFPHL